MDGITGWYAVFLCHQIVTSVTRKGARMNPPSKTAPKKQTKSGIDPMFKDKIHELPDFIVNGLTGVKSRRASKLAATLNATPYGHAVVMKAAEFSEMFPGKSLKIQMQGVRTLLKTLGVEAPSLTEDSGNVYIFKRKSMDE